MIYDYDTISQPEAPTLGQRTSKVLRSRATAIIAAAFVLGAAVAAVASFSGSLPTTVHFNSNNYPVRDLVAEWSAADDPCKFDVDVPSWSTHATYVSGSCDDQDPPCEGKPEAKIKVQDLGTLFAINSCYQKDFYNFPAGGYWMLVTISKTGECKEDINRDDLWEGMKTPGYASITYDVSAGGKGHPPAGVLDWPLQQARKWADGRVMKLDGLALNLHAAGAPDKDGNFPPVLACGVLKADQ